MVRGRAGFTLTEIAVVFSLLLTLLALMAMYFVKGQQYVSDIDAYSTLQRETAVALQRVCDQLARTTPRYLHAENHVQSSDPPSYVYCLSPTPNTPGDPLVEFGGPRHQVIWKKWIGFFHDSAKQEIVFVEIPLTPPTFSLVSQPTPAISYSSLVTAPRPRTVGRRIAEFAVERFDKRLSVTMVGRGVSPVPLRTENDRVLEIHVNSQVSLVE